MAKKSKHMTEFLSSINREVEDSGDCVDVSITIPHKWKYRIFESRDASTISVEKYKGEDTKVKKYNIITNEMEDDLNMFDNEENIEKTYDENDSILESYDLQENEDVANESINEDDDFEINTDDVMDAEEKDILEEEPVDDGLQGVDAALILRLSEFVNEKKNSSNTIREIKKQYNDTLVECRDRLNRMANDGCKQFGLDFRQVNYEDAERLKALYEKLSTIVANKEHVQGLSNNVKTKDENLTELLSVLSGFFSKSTASEEADIKREIENIIYKYRSAYEEFRQSERERRSMGLDIEEGFF